MRNIKYIVIHCSAGFGSVENVQKFWKEKLKWRSPGYHFFIDTDGTVHQLAKLDVVCNGVKGYNANSVHISYQGGVDESKYKAKDTRTAAQKLAIIEVIRKVRNELRASQNISTIQILGHRDFSKDRNGNGIVDSWERIKECPSFDAIPEYKNIS